MADTIRYIDDDAGNHVFPVTHERGVYDDDGISIGTKFTQLSDDMTQLDNDVARLDQELNGEPQQVISTWGNWTRSTVSPYRAYAIADSKTVARGVVTFKLSSYATYKISVAIQDGRGWDSDKISDTGWKTEDVSKQITTEEAGYNIRVSVGRVDNTSITLTEFLSAISELKYEYYSSGDAGLKKRVEDIENSISGLSTMADAIPDYIISGESAVDLGSLTQQVGSMLGGGIWGLTKVARHKALPVTPGQKFVIRGDGNGFWAFLSSSYAPPVSNNDPVPYVSGYTNRVLQKDAVAITVPEGTAYIAFTTVNGSGVSASWSVWQVASYKRRTIDKARLNIAHWNIGQFKYTDWAVGDPTHLIPAADAAEYQQKYHELFNSLGADIIGIAEYLNTYSAAEWPTRSSIFSCFTRAYEGAKKGANSNSIFGNIMEWVGAEEISFTASSYQRYYTHITARFKGENVHIVEAHLDHTYNDMRVAEIAQLIADMSPYKYVIVMGDFNTGDEETIETELAAFTNAGYTMLNDGYVGLVITSLTQEYVDNIVTKGFAMTNIKAYDDSGTLSDHLLVSCELTMQDV